MRSFIFGGDQEAKTPQQLARMREMADALAGANGRAPQNVGEGLQSIGNAILYRQMMNKVNAGEAAGRASGSAAFNNIAAAMSGQSAFPPAPGAPSAARASVDGLNPTPTAHAAERERDPSIAGLQIKGGIEETAKSLGIDPVDLATAISYETGGTFDPAKSGPTTQWGQHRGLIQFGEPQAQKYGVDWNDPVKSQLGADGAIAQYLRDTGVKPGMGLLDIYSAINAGGVGRYDASDANNGGAPGTVRDKVERQMASHRAKAMAMFGVEAPAGAPAPVQVASLDPTAGVAQATAVPPMPEEYAKTGLTSDQWAKMNAADSQAAPMPSPRPIQDRPAAEASQPQQRVAQAVMDNLPVTAGGDAGTITRDAQGGPSMQMLLDAAGNPWLSQGQSGIVNALIEQQMKANDPMRQMEIEKGRLELEKLRNPPPDAIEVNGRLVDKRTGKVIADFPDRPDADPFTLSPGEIRFGADGKQIATGGEKPAEKPSAVQEYEYAKSQGFPGTFQDWEASKKGGMSLQVDPATGAVTFQQGQNIKPLTEGQSKDAVFATRAEGALPLIDQFGDALTSLPETVGGKVPVLGNYAKSEEFQQAEQAGKEFLQAILRKDTGAAITPQETDEYGSVYLPRPGDSSALLTQKRASRQRALEAIKAGMPPQAILYVEKALEKERAATKKAPAVIDGYTIEEVE